MNFEAEYLCIGPYASGICSTAGAAGAGRGVLTTMWRRIADHQPEHAAAIRVRRKTRNGYESMGILSWHASLQIWVEATSGRWWFDDNTEWAAP